MKAPPVEGRANAEVEELLAAVLGLSRSSVSVVGGASSRHKRIEVSGMPAAMVSNKLSAVLSSAPHESG